jgi:NAD(P)-dependent dehydrogenase (short-subunit alcohol dehydrogenase family)
VAVLFAREGCDVAVAYHASTGDAEETRRCVEAEGRRCLLLQGDVKDSAWCESAVAQTVAAFGRLDVLVNNAAFQMHAERLEDIDDQRWQETLDTNIGGYLRMAAAEPGRRARGEGGRIRQGHRHEAARAARGAVAGLRLPGLAGVRQLHQRHRAAGDRQRGRDLVPFTACAGTSFATTAHG